MRMSIIQLLFLIRQPGLRLVSVSQSPSDLAPAILSQSGLVIQVGGMASDKDVRAMAAALGLSHEQAACLPHLGCGEFIARVNMGRYTKPFRGTFHLFPQPRRPFSEADRIAHMQTFLNSLSSFPAIPFDKVVRTLNPQNHGPAVPARVPSGVSVNARDLAYDVLSHPYDFLKPRYDRLHLSGGDAQKAKQELVDQGWVAEHAIPRHGKAPILLEPLAPLAAGLNRALPSFGKGGFTHAFVAHCAVVRLKKQNCKNIRQEVFYGSKPVDVVAIAPNGDLIGIEITCSLGNLVDNLEKDFLVNPRFSSITVICLSASDVRQAQRAIAAAPGLLSFRTRIVVKPVSQWF